VGHTSSLGGIDDPELARAFDSGLQDATGEKKRGRPKKTNKVACNDKDCPYHAHGKKKHAPGVHHCRGAAV